MEANKTNPKDPSKEQKKSEGKSLDGTEKESKWEKAVGLIAGDNQLMSGLLKLLISPFTLIAVAGLIIYLFIKNKGYKDEIIKLKQEIKKLSDEKLLVTSESEVFRKKYKRLQKIIELEQGQVEQLLLPQGTSHSPNIHSVANNKMSYLR